MANETVFNNKSTAYSKSRPSYAPAAIKQITDMVGEDEKIAADIGSGTGIFTGELLSHGFTVYAVEPNDEMRLKAEQQFANVEGFYSVIGTAEKTNLLDRSVSLVTAASAFHWFDALAFRTECRRILKPGGVVCIVHHARVYDTFTRNQHVLFQNFCPTFQSLTHGVEKSLARAENFFEHYRVARYDFPLRYTKERFLQRALSSFYVPENCEELLHELQKLMDEHTAEETLTVANETVVIWGTV